MGNTGGSIVKAPEFKIPELKVPEHLKSFNLEHFRNGFLFALFSNLYEAFDYFETIDIAKRLSKDRDIHASSRGIRTAILFMARVAPTYDTRLGTDILYIDRDTIEVNLYKDGSIFADCKMLLSRTNPLEDVYDYCTITITLADDNTPTTNIEIKNPPVCDLKRIGLMWLHSELLSDKRLSNIRSVN